MACSCSTTQFQDPWRLYAFSTNRKINLLPLLAPLWNYHLSSSPIEMAWLFKILTSLTCNVIALLTCSSKKLKILQLLTFDLRGTTPIWAKKQFNDLLRTVVLEKLTSLYEILLQMALGQVYLPKFFCYVVHRFSIVSVFWMLCYLNPPTIIDRIFVELLFFEVSTL